MEDQQVQSNSIQDKQNQGQDEVVNIQEQQKQGDQISDEQVNIPQLTQENEIVQKDENQVDPLQDDQQGIENKDMNYKGEELLINQVNNDANTIFQNILQICQYNPDNQNSQLQNDFILCFQKITQQLENQPNVLQQIQISFQSKFQTIDTQLEIQSPKLNRQSTSKYDGRKEMDKNLVDEFNKFEHLNDVLIDQIQEYVDQLGEKRNLTMEQKNHWVSENRQLRHQIQSLEEENKKYLSIIVKHSKGKVQELMDSGSKNINQSIVKNAPSTLFRNLNTSVFTTATSGNMKPLNLKQLKDIIDEIYASKLKADAKQAEAKLQRETMEQHMYSYLNKKYGLKNLTMEWANNILESINKFVMVDNDVRVFYKILYNECDEEFRFIQNQVKNTIKQLLKMYLRGKFPLKHKSDIKEMLNQKVEGQVALEEATDIVKYMYSPEDAILITQQLEEHISTTNSNILQNQSKKMSRNELFQLAQQNEKPEKQNIDYQAFQKILLDFQLTSHIEYLSKFLAIFREVDTDGNGIINEAEFREVIDISLITFTETEILKLLKNIDPHNHQSITYTQCVTLFSTEVQGTGAQQKSLLQLLPKDI